MSLIHAEVLSQNVHYKDKIVILTSWGAPNYKIAPSEYCWVQTYVTYSYYEHSRHLLYKNMGMLLNKLRVDGRPRPYYLKTIRLFK